MIGTSKAKGPSEKAKRRLACAMVVECYSTWLQFLCLRRGFVTAVNDRSCVVMVLRSAGLLEVADVANATECVELSRTSLESVACHRNTMQAFLQSDFLRCQIADVQHATWEHAPA
eukprot:2719448-Amphidinium_carterae.1